MHYVVSIFILSLFPILCIETIDPNVKTNLGDIRGIRLNVLGKEIHAYLGVPYAIPPVGSLRFRKPIPANSWEGVYDATRKSPSCPQFSPNIEFSWIPKDNIKEDCLYLNIWVPAIPRKDKATIIWIHGGGFFQGSSVLDLYDGQVLASQGNVIVVSMNYRLGAFGFLYVGTDEAPGNVGLHDQLLAIRWIKDNLRSFGGDPSMITISGQSAGAMSTCFLLLSPLSRGLTNRVILESGSAYNNIFLLSPLISKIVTAIFSSRIGCGSNLRKPKSILRCLRSKSAEEIYNEEIKMMNETLIILIPRYGDDFLPYHPVIMLNDGIFQSADLLIGTTADEGSTFVAWRNFELFFKDRPETTKANAEYYIRDLLRFNFAISIDDTVEKYLGTIPANDSASLLKAAYRAVGANIIVCPCIYISEIYSANSNVYYYHFTYHSSRAWPAFPKWMGVPHLEEIPFVFGDPLRKHCDYLKEEIEFSSNIIAAWSSFAKYGRPHYPPLKEDWPKFSPSNSSYVELNPYRIAIGNNLRKEECDFWR